MNSLFTKILLWFWATLIITTIGSALISGLSPPRPYLVTRLVTFELAEARSAYESGGRAGLQAFMGRFHSVFSGDAVLTDGTGHDLLTGSDESDMLRRMRTGTRPPLFRRGGAVVARGSEDGKYWFFFVIPPRRLASWFVLPEHWWGMGAGIVLCWVLAYYLTRPVRRLQRAVERFGHGDLSARAASPRRDELGDLARTFDRMADRIQSLLDAQHRLLLDISHELRSPLARLRVAVELARSGENPAAALNRIEKEAERLNSLVGGLLQVTRGEGDPDSVRREPVRVDLLLHDIATDASLEANARGSDVQMVAAQPAIVDGDPELLRRAIENIIRNAVRHSPEGTSVNVSLDYTAGRALIRVRDYGTGVPEKALPRIFDAFYRVESDRDRASGGVGLGLSIARRAVELHKGCIRAVNAVPGLAVEIDLPARPA
ncbi:MAG: ATP-binding protein [Bryobacteraceae bacterium]